MKFCRKKNAKRTVDVAEDLDSDDIVAFDGFYDEVDFVIL